MEKTLKSIALIAVNALLILVIVFISMGKFSFGDLDVYTHEQEEERIISVQGEGKISVRPDIATFSLSVISEGKTVKDATEDNSLKMKKVIDSIKALDIKEEDIKTTNYNLNPRYNYDRNPATIEGYRLSQDIVVKVRDLDKVEDVIAEGTNNGANRMSNLQFLVDDEEEYLKEAREEAIAEAKEKAEEIEKTVGITLGKIIGYRELGGNNNYPPVMYERSYAMESMAGNKLSGEDFSIESGSQDIISQIELVYEIK
jgi:uncharacterized protein YggE